MRAQPGNRIRVRSRTVGTPDRTGVVVAVQGGDGGPPFEVRWDGSEQTALVFPGPDAAIDPTPTDSAPGL